MGQEQGNKTNNIITFDTSGIEAPKPGNDLYLSRNNVYESRKDENKPLVSIAVLAYNRIEKTKYCVECILKYTKDIPYELILIDNGSSDTTLEFFKSVDFENKTIYRVTDNVGSTFGTSLPFSRFLGSYLVTVNQDVYVTENWLQNMLRCIESDRTIGLVSPMASNTSNLQNPDLSFNGMDEMQQVAKAFNVSNPDKWRERVRLIPIILMLRREVIDLMGKWDSGFLHDFSDDDLSFRVRRAGYRLMLCGDVFVHHDHYRDTEGDETYGKLIVSGIENFKMKYHGIDPWKDVVNLEIPLISCLSKDGIEGKAAVLGVDMRCGSPLLEIKNELRHIGVSASLTAFSTKGIYFEDLTTVCDEGCVFVDDIEYMTKTLYPRKFDIVILGEHINSYNNYQALLRQIFGLIAPGGHLLFKCRNVTDMAAFYKMLGISIPAKKDSCYIVNVFQLLNDAVQCGMEVKRFIANQDALSQDILDLAELLLSASQICESPKQEVERLQTLEYLICARKSY